mgnify:FL=1
MAVSKKPRKVTRTPFAEARRRLGSSRGMNKIMALIGRGIAVQHIANVNALGAKAPARG